MTDFFVVGGQKCATTSLFKYLNDHPQVCMPKQKEIGFFAIDEVFKKGKKWYEASFPKAISNFPEKIIRGEVSPQYMFTIQAPLRIHMNYPDAKIIMILRNPIDRAFSAYRMLSNRKEINVSFSKATESFIRINKRKELFEDFSTVNFLEAGHYSLILKKYMDLFPRKNILVVFTEDLNSQPEILMQRIFNFLSIEKYLNNELIGKKFHEGGVIKFNFLNLILEYLSKKDLKIIRLLKNLFPGTGYWLRQWNIKKENKQSIPQDDRLKLKEYYSSDVEKLKNFLDQEIPWKEFN